MTARLSIPAPVLPAAEMAPRVLLGPGPAMVHPRVTAAMAAPLLGHLDPDFLELMDRTQHLLRYVFQTDNRLTLPISGTGSAGMEATVASMVEPGEPILVCVNGYFGSRIAEMGRLSRPETSSAPTRNCPGPRVWIASARLDHGSRRPTKSRTHKR